MTDSLKIEFEAKGVSLKISGLEPISQVAQYAADFVGLIGEPLGLITDHLATYRRSQAEAAAMGVQRAIEIKSGRGERIEPVSQKYLTSWIDGASNEDPYEENILELWAQLLSNATKQFDARFLLYNDVLRKIGPEEARLINSMLQPRFIGGLAVRPSDNRAVRRWSSVSDCAESSDQIIQKYVDNFTAPETQDFEIVAKRLSKCKQLLDKLIDGFVVSIWFTHSDRRHSTTQSYNPAFVLQHNGLVEFREVSKEFDRSSKSARQNEICVKYAVPTEIGLGLFMALNEDRMSLDCSIDEVKATVPFPPVKRIPQRLLDLITDHVRTEET